MSGFSLPDGIDRDRDDEAEAEVGRPHRRVKEQFRPAVEAGTVRCWRCGKLIYPYEKWDLGHIDGQPDMYAGPEHSRCNSSNSDA